MLEGIFEKGLIAIIAAGLSFTIPAMVYGERIATVEKDLIISERHSDRLETTIDALETQVNSLEFRTRSNRTFINRECHRNNIHDDQLGLPTLNSCDQDF